VEQDIYAQQLFTFYGCFWHCGRD